MPLLNRKAFDYIRSFESFEAYAESEQPMIAIVHETETLEDGRQVKVQKQIPVDPAVLQDRLAAIPDIDELEGDDVAKLLKVYTERPDTPLSEVVERIDVSVQVALARREALALGRPIEVTLRNGHEMKGRNAIPPQLVEWDSVGHALALMKLGTRRKGTVLDQSERALPVEEPPAEG